jgi:uncharacterized protein YigE (DUF2233 family)
MVEVYRKEEENNRSLRKGCFMKSMTSILVIFTGMLSTILSPHSILSKEDSWKKIDEGLYVGEFAFPGKSRLNAPGITIVRGDPKGYSFKLLCASEHDKLRLTPKKWCQRHRLIAATNAGMYQEDGIRNVGYMKNFGHVNNPRLNAAYKAVLAFNPVESTLPEVQIIDLKCQDFERLRLKYQTLVQNIRMISCQQENVWSKQDKMWSMAVFGIDRNGNALFIFTKTPCSGYEFANILLSIPISIRSAMYLEGGQEASLYFSANDVELERIGFPASLGEDGQVSVARPVPNVIGIVKK